MPKERIVWEHVTEKKSKKILSPEEVAAGVKVEPWNVLDMSNVGLRLVSPTISKITNLTCLYLQSNNIQYMPPEISELRALSILDLSQNQLQEIPAEIGKLRKLRELLLFNNKLRVLPFEIGALFQCYTLGLHGNPLDQPLMTYSQDGTEHVMMYLLDNSPIPDAPPDRAWQPPLKADLKRVKEGQEKFSVFCYNVLCDKYATRSLYAYCPSWALDWDYRKQQILKEITAHSSDIILLQEVETREFFGYFRPELHQCGYEGIFQAKSRARTMGDADKQSVDGCAIFFKNSKFEMKEEYLLEFERLAASMHDAAAPDILNRVMPKDNIAVGVVLEMLPTRQQVFVTNAHLTWDPVYKDVKVIQTVMLLHEVEKKIAELRNPEGGAPAIIVGGDFNSTPDSGVYEFLERGMIPESHPDLRDRNYKGFVEKCGLRHSLKLRSCYSKEMPYTNYTHDFTGTIDYVFYSADTLTPTHVLGAADPEVIGTFDGNPNPHFPSDHFAIAAQLSLTGKPPPRP